MNNLVFQVNIKKIKIEKMVTKRSRDYNTSEDIFTYSNTDEK